MKDLSNIVAELDIVGGFEVLVTCYTYNQSHYIEQALNGFSIQKTDFPFVCLIMDDASTDGEQEVLLQYLEKECVNSFRCLEDDTVRILMASSKTNSNCTFVLHCLKRNLFKEPEIKKSYILPWRKECKYEALCEGDDYWIDPLKLQKQRDFLNNNEDYMLIGSNGLIKYTDTSLGIKYFNDCHTTKEVLFQELVQKWYFPTASLFFRIMIRDKIPSWSKELHFGDDVVVMTCAIHGKVACLGEETCVYRKGVGITTELDKQHIYMYEQHLLFYNHLLQDTGTRYETCLKEKISQLEKELGYYKAKEKYWIAAAFNNPQRFIKGLLSPAYSWFKKKLIKKY